MSANDRQVAGDHYRKNGKEIQHWDFAAAQNFDYFQGQITKYVTRWRQKNGIADLEKAKHFLEKYIELEKEKATVVQKEKQIEPLLPLTVDAAREKLGLPPGDCGCRSCQVMWGTRPQTGQVSPFGFDPAVDI